MNEPLTPRYLPEDDGPARERFEAQLAEFAESMRPRLQAMGEAIVAAAESMSAWGEQMRQAELPDSPPDDPRARALWLRQHRNTGPDRQIQHQRRTKETA